jgi:hypothetical protein
MTLGRLLKTIKQNNIELRPQGFFNTENGRFTVSNRFFDACECHIENLGQFSCLECGRGADLSAVSFPSGDGDGIFVAFEIVLLPDAPGQADMKIGFIAMFDYQYQIATYARNAIAAETLPDFPFELANQFADCLALEIGTVAVDKTLLIGDGSFSSNPQEAVVDFPGILDGNYKCIAYCEEIDASVDGIAERLSRTQGLPEESAARIARIAGKTFEQMAQDEPGVSPGVNPFPPFVPRAIVVVLEGAGSLIEKDEILNPDWDLLKAQFRYGKVDLSHKESKTNAAIWENALLAREYDRAAGECSDAVALRLHFNLRTWLYQGRERGEENCINYLEKLKYEPTDDEEIYLYMRRGMQSAAAKYL